MRANIGGTTHRIVFQHKMEFDTVPGPNGDRKVPKAFKPDLSPWPKFNRQPEARAVTVCAILTGTRDMMDDGGRRGPGDVAVVASAPAVCVWGDQFDKEFARQLALARVVAELPRDVGGALVNAYMQSGRRTACNLTAASRGKYSSLAEALPEKNGA